MINRWVKYAIIGVAITAFIPFGLILSQSPGTARSADSDTLDFDQVLKATSALATNAPMPETVVMRDGYGLQVRQFDNGPGPLIVMLHGSGWNGLQFLQLGSELQGDILLPDLRGHGARPGSRGDVSYIGQFEDDVADLITAKVKPGQKVVLLGHSSGGGLAVRLAGGQHRDLVDAAVLLAPYLHHAAPTMRPNSGGWAHPLLRRIIGLQMLNAVGITALNHITAIEFNMPSAVMEGPLGHLTTTSYSYRMNQSYAPRANYLNDINSLPRFLLVAGEHDEAFVAASYQPLMEEVTAVGQYVLVPEIGHLDLVNAPDTMTAIKGFLREL